MEGNREYKSDVFSMLMEDPLNALELYNAVNGSDYTDPAMVEMCRLENAISLTVRNDAAFVLDGNLSIYEHQSTVCPNIPFRSLIYLAETLRRMMKNRNVYGSTLIKIPLPRFAVFYNGNEEQPECYEMKLSDAFVKPTDRPQAEIICTVYNINKGNNRELLGKCRFLREYMIFVDYVRQYHRELEYENLELAIDRAINRCIEEDVLRDFLTERRAEVKKVMTMDYTFDRQLQLTGEEKLQEGYATGMEKGIEAFVLDNLEEGFPKEKIISKLTKRFKLSDADAEKYYSQFAQET